MTLNVSGTLSCSQLDVILQQPSLCHLQTPLGSKPQAALSCCPESVANHVIAELGL